MFCRKCGKELEENVRFCQYCGEKINEKSESQNKTRKNILSKWWWVIAVGIIGLGMFVFIQRQETIINLEECIRAEFCGYDTVGAGAFYIDNTEIPEELRNAIYLTPDYSENLSNGDEIVISIHYDNARAKEYGVKLSGEQVTIKVSGLTELVEITPFDSFSFETYGISPLGMANFSYNGDNEYVKTGDFYYYNIEDEMPLRNGDIVTIEYRNPQNPAEYGYKITEYFRDYIVEGLDEYVESFDELSESFLSYAKEEAEDSINSYAAREYSDNVGMSPLEYVGYIYKVQNNSNAGEYNAMYLVYRAKISSVWGYFDEQYIYYPVKFNNIILSNGISADMQGIEGYISEPIKTVGDRYPTQIYEELVTASQDLYNVTIGDGFEVYAENSFINSISDIGKEMLQSLEGKAVALVTEYVENDQDFTWYTIGETKVVGEYFLVAKNQDDLKTAENQVIVVCNVNLVDDSGNSFWLYLPVLYEDVEVLPDGEFVYSMKEITGYYRGVDGYGASLSRGYLDESEMYNDLVKEYRNNFDEEVYGNLQAY